MTGNHIERLAELLAAGEAAMLVHVAEIRGSAPREAGARMLVWETDFAGTIGGGELEYRAIRHARTLLAGGRAEVAQWSLGPELGQCCGGSVTLVFEPFAPADCAWVVKAVAAAAGEGAPVRVVRIGRDGTLSRTIEPAGPTDTAFAATVASDAVTVREALGERPFPLWLFGAGHVGRAVAAAVAPLGFALTWVDGRAGQFPPNVPDGVRTLELAMPELIVDDAPPGTMFLVMTHSHPLDEEICAAVLQSDGFAYLGLIGSKTKRARFRSRLAARGLSDERIARLTCPIGLPAIRGKAPAVIAASVAADLLVRRQEGLAVAPTAAVTHGR